MSENHANGGSPLTVALSRVGATLALVYFLFAGIGPSIRYGRSIGETFIHALAVGPLEGEFFSGLLIVLGVLLMGLAIMMFFVLFGALLGSLVGAILSPHFRTLNGNNGRNGDGEGAA